MHMYFVDDSLMIHSYHSYELTNIVIVGGHSRQILYIADNFNRYLLYFSTFCICWNTPVPYLHKHN